MIRSIARGALAIACAAVVTTSAAAQLIPDRPTLDAILGGGQIFEDFESFDIADGNATVLDVFTLDSSTIGNGQGPNLVMAGAVYSDPGQTGIQWNGHNYFGLQTKTILASTNTLVIDYTTAVTAMGLDLRGFEGFGWSGTVLVFDTSNNQVSSTPVSITNGGAENLFFGWQHAGGIGRIEISNTTHGWSPLIDNHGYGVPAPGAIALLGLAGLAARRRRRN